MKHRISHTIIGLGLLVFGCAVQPQGKPELGRASQGASEGPPLPLQGANDDWCTPCEDQGQCPNGWFCAASGGNPDVRWCGPGCVDDGDCREDHDCLIGVCRPRVSAGCVPEAPAQIWDVDACGGAILADSACPDGTLCSLGICRAGLAGDQCEDAEVIEPITQVIRGRLQSYINDTRGSCGGGGVERVYQFTLDTPSPFEARMVGDGAGNNQNLDSVLYLRRSCDGEEVVCNDDEPNAPGFGSLITADLEAGTYYLFADTFGRQQLSFILTLDFTGGCPLSPCDVGERECVDDVTARTCEVGADGCPEWSPPEPCVQGSCQAGFCVNDCMPADCEIGESRCAGIGGSQTCGVSEAGCVEWLAAVPCPVGELCQGGACGQACPPAPCAVGQTRCQGELVQRCAVSGDGCVRWEAPAFCPGGEVCSGSGCAERCPDEPCTPGTRGCDGLDSLICGQDEAGCGLWQIAERCGQGERCIAGACIPANECPMPACEVGEARCVGEATLEFCGIDDFGCVDWVERRMCPEGTACDDAGQLCVPVEVCPPPPCDEGEVRCAGERTIELCLPDGEGCLGWSPFGACEAGTVCEGAGRCVASGGGPGDTCDAPLPLGALRPLRLGLELGAEYAADVRSPCAREASRDAFFSFEVDSRVLLTLSPVMLDTVTVYPEGCPADAFLGCSRGGPLAFELEPGSYVIQLAGEGLLQVDIDVEQLCRDECFNAEPECLDERTVQTCEIGPEGCFESVRTACPVGRVCQRGRCLRGPVVPPDMGPPPEDAEVPDAFLPPPPMDGGVPADAAPPTPDGSTGSGLDGGPVRPDGGYLGQGADGPPTMRGGRGCEAAPRGPAGWLWLIGALAWGIGRRRS